MIFGFRNQIKVSLYVMIFGSEIKSGFTLYDTDFG